MALGKSAADRKKGRRSAGITSYLVIFLVCIVLMLASRADLMGTTTLRGMIAVFFAPLAEVVSVPFRAMSLMIEGIDNLASMREENQRLKDDLGAYTRAQNQLDILLAENRQLRALTSVPVPEGMEVVSARIIAINSDSFAHSVMLDAGSRHGIAKGAPVTTVDGLVGIVVDVSASYAQVLLISDLNMMVPVILSDSSWPAVTAGINGALLELRFVPAQAEVELGDLVQTSGHGGVLPAGMPVGRVVQIADKAIYVKPIVDFSRLSFVTVLNWAEGHERPRDPIFEQSFVPLPESDEGFSLEGFNALGQRVGDANGEEQ